MRVVTMLAWAERARCVGTPIDLWYPKEGELVPAEASALCDCCPVRGECLEYSLAHEAFGVWAGTSMRKREQLRRRARINLDTPGVPWHPRHDPTDEELAAIEAAGEGAA